FTDQFIAGANLYQPIQIVVLIAGFALFAFDQADVAGFVIAVVAIEDALTVGADVVLLLIRSL
ncbi:hypothetical protein PT286_10180, partial [Neisseriaceae bacterium ESL0693]|nr:hypothetical protein [Neisseriaceae bacterium ESL0693]